MSLEPPGLELRRTPYHWYHGTFTLERWFFVRTAMTPWDESNLFCGAEDLMECPAELNQYTTVMVPREALKHLEH